MIANLQKLHGIAKGKSDDYEALQAVYIKIKSLDDLAKTGEQFGVNLVASDDVPIMLVQNKYRQKPSVVTLIDLLENDDAFYSSFRPLKEVTNQNVDKFRTVLRDLEDDQVILFQYGQPEDDETKKLRASFYDKTLHPKLANAFTVDSMFVQNNEWLSKDIAEKMKTGDIYMLQKHGKTVLGHVETIELEGVLGKFVMYKVAEETFAFPLSVKELVQTAGEKFYARNLSVNRHLMPAKSQTVIDFSYDANKLSPVQQSMAFDLFKQVRSVVDIADSHDVVRLVVNRRSFAESEDRVVSLTLKEIEKNDRRIEYLFGNQSKEKMKEMLKDHPEVASNDSFEVQYPGDFGFTADHVKKFIELALAGQIPDSIQSENEPKYERFSRKLCGDSFVEKVKNNSISQAIFIYSPSCSSCNKFTPMYEKLSKDNIEKGFMLTGMPTVFNRMNKDRNDIRGDKNYDSTPVIMLYRGDHKDRPYLYKQPMLTEPLLKDFVTLSSQFSLLTESQLTAAVNLPVIDVGALLTNTN